MISISPEELSQILGDKSPPEPTFLKDKAEVINATGDAEQPSTEQTVTESVQEGKYKCKHNDGFSTDTLPSLMNHYRVAHPKPKKENNEQEVDDDFNTPKEDKMTDEDKLPAIFEGGGVSEEVVEVEEAKKPKKKYEKDIAVIPNDYDRLASLLNSFGVPNWKGVVEGMKLYSLTDINALKDLLRNVSTPQGKAEAIVKMWSELQGINQKSPVTSLNSIGDKPSSPTDALSLMAKLRDEEIQDSIVQSYQEKLKGKQIENELAKRRLSGELIEGKGMSEMEKLLTMMQIMHPKDNGIGELKLQFAQLQNQLSPKNDPTVELLKQQVAILQQQLASPKTDAQTEALKLQVEASNKQIEEMRRKQEEDNKLGQIREEARRDREALEKRLEAQALQTQELIKSMQIASQPKTEDLLKQQITDMQKQFNDQLLKLNNDFLNTRKEEEHKRELEFMKEELKNAKEGSEGQIGQLGGILREALTTQKHESEMLRQDVLHQRETDELKKKMSDMEHNKTLTNEQYVFEKTSRVAEEVGKSVANALGGFGEALKPSINRSAETTTAYDKAKLALDLKQQGLDSNVIAKVLDNGVTKPGIQRGSAEAEWQRLQRSIEVPPVPQPQNTQIEVVDNVVTPEPVSEPVIAPVKFNSEDN